MRDSGAVIAIVVLALLWLSYLGSAVVTGLKGKSGMVMAGLFFCPCWWIGAIRLAKPDSWWARKFYDEDKLADARERFPAVLPVYVPRRPRR
jgi:hypothetical protein